MKNRILIVCILILSLVLGQTSFAFAATSSSNKPKAPTMNSAVLADDGSVDVVWSKVSGADKYEIYRATSKSGKYIKIATVSSKNRIFNDADVEDYKNYYYKLKTVDGGKKSDYSKVVSTFTEGYPIGNSTMEFHFKFDNGEEGVWLPGDGMNTGARVLHCTFKYKGEPTDDYELIYDKNSVKITRGKNGKLTIEQKVAGKYLITFVKGDEKGTFELSTSLLERGNVSFEWKWHKEDRESTQVYIPKEPYTVLKMKHNGKAITDYKVTVSNKNVCTVKKDGSKLTVTNKGPGLCKITVTYKGKKTVFHWLVKRGKATADYNFINNVPVAKSLDKETAKAIIEQFTTPKYTKKQIQQLAKDNLTLDEYVEKISTAADAINLLYALDYGKEWVNLNDGVCTSSKVTSTDWVFDYSAEQNFEIRYGMCAGTSNMMNRLLMDDFENMGYVMYCNSESGGHIFNYYKVDDVYVIGDFVDIIHDLDYNNKKYPVDITQYLEYVCSTPEEFFEIYWMTNTVATVADPEEGLMAYLTFYEHKGDPMPTGFAYNDHTTFALPETYKDVCDIIYIRDGYSVEFRPLEEAAIPSFRQGKVLQ